MRSTEAVTVVTESELEVLRVKQDGVRTENQEFLSVLADPPETGQRVLSAFQLKISFDQSELLKLKGRRSIRRRDNVLARTHGS